MRCCAALWSDEKLHADADSGAQRSILIVKINRKHFTGHPYYDWCIILTKHHRDITIRSPSAGDGDLGQTKMYLVVNVHQEFFHSTVEVNSVRICKAT